ncbi:MAG: hypothetical protein A3G18_05630 [Rhodospirillales bacterium RIFCSPLOWO2_12_FULL_58_28]|nr:MAG: hypothetical protein A3H92_00630 [Rhodospirillales bacterium RIFCSPLOWO2_02_FULL_58_16]OHC79426.1 MAG: hypothetical protein A3G18_05630 [Rhodospirillales bacterium RIFCSPLOWO2_12_FULL_58_28]
MCFMNESKKAPKGPHAVTVEGGEEYHWCRCGQSADPPWCDGSHKSTPYKPVAFVAKKTETVHLCGCLKTKNTPFCDGTHNKP